MNLELDGNWGWTVWQMTGWRTMAGFLALRRNTALLLVALVLAGTGERLWLGFAPKYLENLGATILIIGLFDALQTLLGAVYAYPGGWLKSSQGRPNPIPLRIDVSLSERLCRKLCRQRLATKLHSPVVFDGRNIWDTEVIRNAGFVYYSSIGRLEVNAAILDANHETHAGVSTVNDSQPVVRNPEPRLLLG